MSTQNRSLPPVRELLAERGDGWLQPWSEFAARTQLRDLPGPVVDQAKLVLLDTIGVIASGMAEPEMRRLTETLGGDAGPVPVIGAGVRRSAGTACLLNGAAGTMLELDEGNQYSGGHPGVHVIPALLAVASARPVSGAAFLTSLVLGYDLGARIGIAARRRMSMHPHGTWGTVGAGLAVAKLSGAGATDIAGAVNVAADLTIASSRRTIMEGATVRNMYCGAANQLGLLAWQMHQAGFTGEADGVATVFGVVSGEAFDPAKMTEALGERWEITRNYFKRHAACRYLHGPLDALDQARAKAGSPFAAEDVEAIEVHGYAMSAQLDNPAPQTTLAAKFSLPFALASSVVHGAASVPAFQAEAMADPRIAALIGRVKIDEDPAYTAAFPAQRPARVAIVLKDGRRLQGETIFNRGDEEDPYSPAEVRAKFDELAGAVWSGDGTERIARLVMALDGADDVTPLLAALADLPVR